MRFLSSVPLAPNTRHWKGLPMRSIWNPWLSLLGRHCDISVSPQNLWKIMPKTWRRKSSSASLIYPHFWHWWPAVSDYLPIPERIICWWFTDFFLSVHENHWQSHLPHHINISAGSYGVSLPCACEKELDANSLLLFIFRHTSPFQKRCV